MATQWQGLALVLIGFGPCGVENQQRPLPNDEPKPRFSLRGHSHEVISLVFTPDGKTLASLSRDGSVILWDTTTGTVRMTVKQWEPAPRGQPVAWGFGGGLAISPDGKLLAVGGGALDTKPSPLTAWAITLWYLGSGKQRGSLLGHQSIVTSLIFLQDGKTLASGSLDGTVRLWAVATQKELAVLGTGRSVRCIASSPDGNTLAVGGTPDQSHCAVKLWDIRTRKVRLVLTGHADTVEAVLFSHDGQTVISTGLYEPVRIWDTRTGKMQTCLERYRCLSMALTADGKIVALGGRGSVLLLEWATAKPLCYFSTGQGRQTPLAFAPNRKMLASGGQMQDLGVRLSKKQCTGWCTATDSLVGPHRRLVASQDLLCQLLAPAPMARRRAPNCPRRRPAAGKVSLGVNNIWAGTIKLWDLPKLIEPKAGR
jgi:WD40 repeat protein